VHFVGHSTGGAIGMAVAARHPERLRSMLLYASVHRADDYRRRVWGHRKRVLQQMGPHAYAQTTSLFFYPPEYIAANSEALQAAEIRAAEREVSAPEIMASRIDAILGFDIAAALPAVGVPTLVFCAEDDLLTPAYFSREIAGLIPGAQLQLVPHGGHAYSRSQPEPFNTLVAEFIGQHTA
jgi:aminoacrylate hydrolase